MGDTLCVVIVRAYNMRGELRSQSRLQEMRQRTSGDPLQTVRKALRNLVTLSSEVIDLDFILVAKCSSTGLLLPRMLADVLSDWRLLPGVLADFLPAVRLSPIILGKLAPTF